MKIFKEYSQSQGLLLPPSLDEFVPENHQARIVNEAASPWICPTSRGQRRAQNTSSSLPRMQP